MAEQRETAARAAEAAAAAARAEQESEELHVAIQSIVLIFVLPLVLLCGLRRMWRAPPARWGRSDTGGAPTRLRRRGTDYTD